MRKKPPLSVGGQQVRICPVRPGFVLGRIAGTALQRWLARCQSASASGIGASSHALEVQGHHSSHLPSRAAVRAHIGPKKLQAAARPGPRLLAKCSSGPSTQRKTSPPPIGSVPVAALRRNPHQLTPTLIVVTIAPLPPRENWPRSQPPSGSGGRRLAAINSSDPAGPPLPPCQSSQRLWSDEALRQQRKSRTCPCTPYPCP